MNHKRISPWFVIIALIFGDKSFLSAQEKYSASLQVFQKSIVELEFYDDKGIVFAKRPGVYAGNSGAVLTYWEPLARATRVEMRAHDGKLYPITAVVSENREMDLVRFAVKIPETVFADVKWAAKWPSEDEKVLVAGRHASGGFKVWEARVVEYFELPLLGKTISISIPITKEFAGVVLLNRKNELVGLASSFQDKNHALILTQDLLSVSGQAEPVAWDLWKAKLPVNWASSDDGHYASGLRATYSGDDERAVSYFKSALGKNENHLKAQYYLARSYRKLKRYPEAIENYRKVIRLNPDFWDAYAGLSNAYKEFGKTEDAIKILQQFSASNPDHAEAYARTGQILSEEKNIVRQ
jgi:tetratricopeptide (TPR) repeat protein